VLFGNPLRRRFPRDFGLAKGARGRGRGAGRGGGGGGGAGVVVPAPDRGGLVGRVGLTASNQGYSKASRHAVARRCLRWVQSSVSRPRTITHTMATLEVALLSEVCK
jgi:hypothetical protein